MGNTLLWMVLVFSGIQAQNFPGGGSTFGRGNNSSNQQGSPQDEFESHDTTKVLFTYPFVSGQHFIFADTFLKSTFQWYDPIHAQSLPYNNLANIGSAAYSFLFEEDTEPGLDLGFHAYDIYKLKKEDLAFYKSRVAFTELFYSQDIQNQNDGYFTAKFGRTFNNNLRLAIDYRRIYQTTDLRSSLNTAQYNSQKSRHSAISVGLWKDDPKKKHQFIAIFSNNLIRHLDVGGLAEDVQPFVDINQDLFSLETLIDDAFSREDDNVFSLRQFYAPFKGAAADSSRFEFRLRHELEFRSLRYKFFDEVTSAASDSSFYNQLLLDPRGLRHVLKDFSFSTGGGLEFLVDLKGSPLSLYTGLNYARHRITEDSEQGSIGTTVNNVYATGEAAYSIANNIFLKGSLDLYLAESAGNYKVSGDLIFDLKKKGTIRAGIINSRARAPWISERLFVNRTGIWENSFNPIFKNTIWGEYRLPAVNATVGLRNVLVSNYIYYDDNLNPVQASTAITSLQLYAKVSKKLWIFFARGELFTQINSDNSVIRLLGNNRSRDKLC